MQPQKTCNQYAKKTDDNGVTPSEKGHNSRNSEKEQLAQHRSSFSLEQYLNRATSGE